MRRSAAIRAIGCSQAVRRRTGRKPAITHYRVRERFRAQTLIECRLETGRTHQIRVHMAHVRHPLVGDAHVRRRAEAAERRDAANSPRRCAASIARRCTPSGSNSRIRPTDADRRSKPKCRPTWTPGRGVARRTRAARGRRRDRATAVIVPDWPAPPHLRAVVTTRALPGNSKPPFDRSISACAAATTNIVRREPCAARTRRSQLPKPPRWLQQVHGTDVCTMPKQSSTASQQADAAFTHLAGRRARDPHRRLPADAALRRRWHRSRRVTPAGAVCRRASSKRRSRVCERREPTVGVARSGDRCVRRMKSAMTCAMRSSRRHRMRHPRSRPTRTGHWPCDLYALARQTCRPSASRTSSAAVSTR